MNSNRFCMSLEEFERIPCSQRGSTTGGVYTHLNTGRHYYIKFPDNPEQAKTEIASSTIHANLGVPTLRPFGRDISGRIGVISTWRPDLANFSEEEIKTRTRTNHDFALDMVRLHLAGAMTRNHDVIGQFEEVNVMKTRDGHNHICVDQGGSFEFRAQGERKEFGNDAVEDFHSMLDTRRPSGQIFSIAYEMTSPEEQLALRKMISKLSDDTINLIISQTKLPQRISENLISRRESLVNMK